MSNLVSTLDPKKPVVKRRSWSREETTDLINGCVKYGVGNWKAILEDSRYCFCRRTTVDLKDRFRSVYPSVYQELYPASKEIKKRKSAIEQDVPTLVRAPRRGRRLFDKQENESLLLGVERYGVSWSKIAKDPELNLSHRKSMDLRDRFRNAYPDRYALLGYTPRRSITRAATQDIHKPIDKTLVRRISTFAVEPLGTMPFIQTDTLIGSLAHEYPAITLPTPLDENCGPGLTQLSHSVANQLTHIIFSINSV
ncbi:hypothetical protein CLU79DRAFT_750603 [Phycomyces nitens]|nr:hypothetical protein CLU79DRAFT_750603 [Phycomyces nitens]